MQTVFALATARGKAGGAIIRISGPEAASIGVALCGSLPEPGQHAVRTLHAAEKNVLDQALILFFAGPNSFTGEDVVELHLHGAGHCLRVHW